MEMEVEMLSVHTLGDPDGRPVLFLHPGNTVGTAWKDVVDQLPGINGICPDLPGFGASAHLPLKDFEDSADHLARFLEAEGLGPLPVIGYSLGAYTGMMLTLRHPHLVEKALLTSFQVMPLKGRWYLVPFLNVISPLMTTFRARKSAFKGLGVENAGSWSVTPTSPCDARTLRSIGRLACDFDIRDQIHSIARPVLVMSGDQEMESIQESVHLVAEASPNANGAFASGGHGWPVVSSAIFLRTLKAWLVDAPLPDALKIV
ncbi:alpha/beta fold hydrolase [Gymnodinialimonas hymeniacidonis]|uniref:alpha/beta fold hydrolase n=1 Tax=Gymnodinialimonas hymeniacidonis TaxID=3126508 RepID=UPI0034C5F1D5